MPSAHIVVDARMAFAAGIGRHLRNLVPRLAALAPDMRFSLLGDQAKLSGAAWTRHPNVSAIECRAPIYSVREQWVLARRIPADATAFWAPNYNVPVFSGKPLIVTIHDVAHLRLAAYRQNVARRVYADTMFEIVRRRAAAILCVSAFTRDELARSGSVRTSLVKVVHNGVDPEWAGASTMGSPISEPYLIFVGDAKPHKNLPVLLEAFRIVADDLGVRLVLIGRVEGYRTRDEAVSPLVEQLGNRVVVPGEVDDSALRRWVQHARALIAPSTYEGFGLTPLEAMASGTPVVAARAGALPEVCGDAALYFEPSDPRQLADRITEVMRSEQTRARMIELGRARARSFDWNVSAKETLEVLRGVINNAT